MCLSLVDTSFSPETKARRKSFRVTVLIEDETDQAHAVLTGKEAEEICGISCEDLIIKKNCKNQRIIPQEILQLEGEIKLLKLKTGTKRDFLIKGLGIRRCSQVHTNPRYRTNNFHAKSC
ncbi:putative nucleic acid-binding protein [Rosa chinensis]|uniref:Putative nucleic acid-binding protein n=1 Tax=Rosa chinensis TaxID=74649 RepID=A0A2P6RYM7_ROSCH|nr:putative nucleic acid-binding protein [Rosa chinensis]